MLVAKYCLVLFINPEQDVHFLLCTFLWGTLNLYECSTTCMSGWSRTYQYQDQHCQVLDFIPRSQDFLKFLSIFVSKTESQDFFLKPTS